MKRTERSERFGMTLFFTMSVFASLLINTVVVACLGYFLVAQGLWELSEDGQVDVGKLILLQAAISVVVGALLSFLVSKVPLNPVRRLVDGMNALADGRFETRMDSEGILWRYPAYAEVSESFNTLAAELESTEMLRSDFINNFSHEFKTPIVSIAGFAKLLRRGNLSPEQQREYLQVIEEESMRLSYMATNVLNLTKVENQTILTDLSVFNLSEQLRSCILLLESKWDKKQIEFQLHFDEHDIRANEELLKQVWINLLDNAVKFSPAYGMIEVRIDERADSHLVTVKNTGSRIPEEAIDRIFNKFYQADESHAAEGNGVGLAIVKRVVELHGGSISVCSANDVTAFTVELPKL